MPPQDKHKDARVLLKDPSASPLYILAVQLEDLSYGS